MTTPGDRFKSWAESLADSWKDRLRGWMASWLGFGIDVFMTMLSRSFSRRFAPLLKKIEESGKVPPELQPILDEMKEPTGEAAAALLTSLGNRAASSVTNDLMGAILRPLSYWANTQYPSLKIGPDLVLQWLLRHPESIDEMSTRLREWGYADMDQAMMFELLQVRFPSDVVAPAWLRDKAKYAKYWDDVRSLGVDKERLELLKEMAYRIPGVQDIIRYVVKEAYSPEIYKAFGQDQEYPAIAEADAEKTGVRPDMLMKEWIAHWELPSVGNGFEMLHRGEITPEQLALLLKARDIMPFWRDKLTAISWSLPTRIEVRMMAQLGLVDKAFIMDIMAKDGLAEEYRSVVADMNIVRGIRSDLQTRYTKKWLDSAGVKAEIEKSGLSPDIGERLYQWIVSNTKPERTTAEKDLTAAEIIKGVKNGLITWDDGLRRLMTLGYDEEEATFKLAIDVEVVETEPTTELNVRVDTIRRQRRQRLITRDQEISSLLHLGLDIGLATAYADNDDLRLVKEATGGTQ